MINQVGCTCLFTTFHLFLIKAQSLLAFLLRMSDMRKQRKMGHITIVGTSMGDVERRLDSMLNEEKFDSQPAC